MLQPISSPIKDAVRDGYGVPDYAFGIVNLRDKVIRITSLPCTIIEKIAYALPAKDYENFRASCKFFSEINKPYAFMMQELNAGKCSGELGDRYKKHVAEKMGEHLADVVKANPGMKVEMARIRIGKNPIGLHDLTLARIESTPFHKHPIDKTLTTQPQPQRDSGNNPIGPRSAPAKSGRFLPGAVPGKRCNYDLVFRNDAQMVEDVISLFSDADNEFSTLSGPEKYVFSSFFTGIKDYWVAHPLKNVPEDVMKKVADSHKALFFTGQVVQKHFPLASAVTKDDYK